jgi:hypothetical protein
MTCTTPVTASTTRRDGIASFVSGIRGAVLRRQHRRKSRGILRRRCLCSPPCRDWWNSVGEKGGTRVDVIERVRRKGSVTGEDVDPVPVRVPEAIVTSGDGV